MPQKYETQVINAPFRYRVLSKMKGLLPNLYKSFFSIVIFICICISHNFLPSVADRINAYPSIENIFLACSGVLIAIVSLTISLAIIPIQRAIEVFSPSIRRNYINDVFIQSILISLGTFVFVSFFLPFVNMQNSWKIYLQIQIIAISLDLIRWHFRRISFFLEPYNAIMGLSKRICSLITKTERTIAESSYEALKKRPRDEWSPELLKQIELYYYKCLEKRYVGLLNFWVDELEDITLRAITRSERLTVKHGINSIVRIVHTFLDSRKANFQLYPEGLFAFGSDLDDVINPVYEKMINLCRLAIHSKDEQSAIEVVNALSSIATSTVELKGYHEHSAPLASLPIGYLQRCSELSYNSDLDEISWNVVNQLRRISEKAPDNLMISDVHSHVLRNLSSIGQHYFLSKSDHIANRAISSMCHVAHHLVAHNHYDARSVLCQLLRELEGIVPFMLLKETPLDMNAFPPYSMANADSLGYIVAAASARIEPTQDKQWINPYRNFMELNREIFMHFRHIAENTQYDVQKSFLSWVITDTIKHIARVYLDIVKAHITDDSRHNEEFVNQVGWYQSFFWAMFSEKIEVDPNRAEEACDAMATIGLQFANADYYRIAEGSIDNIFGVAKYYIEKSEIPSEYDIANMLIRVWEFRRFAEHKGNTQLLQKADEKVKQVIDLASLKQPNSQEAFDTRKQQLDEHLRDYNPVRIPTRSSDYLRLFIQNTEEPGAKRP